jgi:chemotaxis protein methyltransferase CheR
MPEISISDTRNLIRDLKQAYRFDVSRYSLNHLRFRLDKFLKKHYLKYPDVLGARIAEEPSLFQDLLREIETPSTELFRDPEMWKMLANEIIPLLVKEHGQVSIELPQCVGGNELFSLCILITNSGFSDNTEVKASFLSNFSMERVKSGSLNPASLELGMENYKHTGQNVPLNRFIKNRGGEYFIECEALNNVMFFIRDLHGTIPQHNPHLILFRNKFMEYTLEYSRQLSDQLINALQTGGFIVIGHKEHLPGNSPSIKMYTKSERIYRKTV